jgi:hypothetical protein
VTFADLLVCEDEATCCVAEHPERINIAEKIKEQDPSFAFTVSLQGKGVVAKSTGGRLVRKCVQGQITKARKTAVAGHFRASPFSRSRSAVGNK